MKGDFSRLSFTPGSTRSGVLFQQGRVVTDSDLTEAGLIAAEMADTALLHAFGSGAPAAGGIVDVAGPALRAGAVVADGLAGHVEATGTPAGAFGIYAMQRDFPQPPAVPAGQAGFYYADVWRRAIDCDEDPTMTDVALGSQETSARQATVAQIRWAPIALKPNLGVARHELPCIGTGTIAAEAVAGDEGPDPCDPCATEIEGDLALDNLFVRVEVVHVEGPANAPTAIEIAWSRENASARTPRTTPETGFADSGVFEHHSRVSELHMGAFADPATRRRSAFTAALPGSPSPSTDGAAAWPRVRRWDGHVRIMTATRAVTRLGTGFTASVGATGLAITIGLDIVSFTLTLTNRDVLAGDAWGLLVRDRAPDPERVVAMNGGAAIGIRHHYLKLIEVNATGGIVPLTDAERRQLSAPVLSDIPASHVGVDPDVCPRLFNGAENLQDALKALCAINAGSLPFVNNCPGLWDGAHTVQDALDRLCHTDFSPQQGYRTLFDWGVACGLNVVKEGNMVHVSPGAFLDRSGRLIGVDADVMLDINDAAQVKFLPATNISQGEERCLCVAAAADGTLEWYLVPKANAFGPADPGLGERLDAINDMGGVTLGTGAANTFSMAKIFHFDAAAATVPPPVSAKFRSYAAMRTTGVDSSLGIENHEVESAKAAVRMVMTNYTAAGGVLAEGLSAKVDAQLGLINSSLPMVEFNNQLEATVGMVVGNIEDQKRHARCAAQLTPCPPPLGPRPWLVPIACVKMTIRADLDPVRLDPGAVCAQCCRKQALTLRTMRYRNSYYGAKTDDMVPYHEDCCRPDTPSNPFIPWLDPGIYQIDPNIHVITDAPNYGYHGGTVSYVGQKDTAIYGTSQVRATQILQGFGATIAHTVDLDDSNALVQLDQASTLPLEERFAAGGQFKAGDKLALITRGGAAVGWQVLERGDYVPPYAAATTAAAAAVSPEALRSAVTEVIGAIPGIGQIQGVAAAPGLVDERAAAAALVADLKSERDAVAHDLDALKAQATAIGASRDALAADVARLDTMRSGLVDQIGTLGQQVTKLTDRQVTLKTEMTDTLKSLLDIQANSAKLLGDMRAALPVNAATNVDAALGGQLIGENVRTLGDMAALPDTRLGEIAKKLNIPRTKLDAIRVDAQALVAKGTVG